MVVLLVYFAIGLAAVIVGFNLGGWWGPGIMLLWAAAGGILLADMLADADDSPQPPARNRLWGS